MSVITPIVVPLTLIFAPIIDSPLLSITVPSIVFICCENMGIVTKHSINNT